MAYPAAMTSLAGLALMAGGSTPRHGPYARNVKRAMLYILRVARQRTDGLIAVGSQPMYGHGFSMLFLAQCYGMEGKGQYGKEIRQVLTRAVALTTSAQSKRGGWTYSPGGGDEGSVTVTQLQALRACRNVGIDVPKSTIDQAVGYLRACQNPDGGIKYRFGMRGGGSRPPISAAAIACFYAAGVYERDQAAAEARTVAKLIAYCKKTVTPERTGGHWFYAHYYMAQAMYQRGGDDYQEYYPKLRDKLIGGMQQADGSWPGDGIGKVYGTALACVMLQLPYGYLPIYQR